MATKNKPTNQPTNTGLVLLTEDAIRAGMYGGAGLKKAQAALLGIKNIQKGWMERLIGVRITETAYQRFLELGQTGKTAPKGEKKNTWHVRDGLLTFGKHKGSALEVVLRDDPSYLAWACENMEGFEINLTAKARKVLSKTSHGRSSSLSHTFRSKPATRLSEGKKQACAPRVQPPPEEERYFTPKELYVDDSLDIDAANDPDIAPW